MADVSKIKLNGTVYNLKDAEVREELEDKVTGPASSTSAHVATFNGTSGKIIQDSGFTIATSVPANAVFTDTLLYWDYFS